MRLSCWLRLGQVLPPGSCRHSRSHSQAAKRSKDEAWEDSRILGIALAAHTSRCPVCGQETQKGPSRTLFPELPFTGVVQLIEPWPAARSELPPGLACVLERFGHHKLRTTSSTLASMANTPHGRRYSKPAACDLGLALGCSAKVCMVFETMGPNVLALIKRPLVMTKGEELEVGKLYSSHGECCAEGTTSRASPWILCARSPLIRSLAWTTCA